LKDLRLTETKAALAVKSPQSTPLADPTEPASDKTG